MKKPEFYKKTLILLILILFLLMIVFPSGITLAQEINHCLNGTAGFRKIKVLGGVTWYDQATNINDNNENSYVGGEVGEDNPVLRYEAWVTFTEPTVINRVEYINQASRNCYNPFFYDYIKTFLYYNGAWHQIDSRTASMSKTLITITAGAPWNDVSEVKVEVFLSDNCMAWGLLRSKVYELRAFGPGGPSYIDIGLRVYNSNFADPIPIAAWPLGQEANSPLRIYRDGNVYGIVLVDPGDPNDSGVRIQTSSGTTKALRKYP